MGTTYRGLLINADRDFAAGKGPFTGNGPGGTMLPQWIIGGAGGIGAPSDAADSSVSAGLGQATNVGKLSAPPKWASAAPTFRTVAYSLPTTGAVAAPDMVAGGSGSLFSDLALAGLAGRTVGSAAHSGRPAGRISACGSLAVSSRNHRSRLAAVWCTKWQLNCVNSPHAQSLLAKLHDSGLMSAEDITVERKRFPF